MVGMGARAGAELRPVLQLLFLPLYPKSAWILLPTPHCCSSLCSSMCPLWISALSLSLSILLFFSHISLPLDLSIPHWEQGVLWGADGSLRPGPWPLGVTPSLD